jgi:hypothetical protein
MTTTDADLFLANVAQVMLGVLKQGEPLRAGPAHWLMVSRSGSLELSDVDETEPIDLLQSAVAQGADAAAYLTHTVGFGEQILAYVLIAEPRNSDLRRSAVLRQDDEIALGPWEYTV